MAIPLEELELGLNAVAAPIYSMTGSVVAALSVSGPSYRVSQERISELGELTKQAGRDFAAFGLQELITSVKDNTVSVGRRYELSPSRLDTYSNKGLLSLPQ